MLAKCYECGEEISSEASTCPHCGYHYSYTTVAYHRSRGFVRKSAEDFENDFSEIESLHEKHGDGGGGDRLAAVTDEDFNDKVLKVSLPVLVHFYAPWCGPARLLAAVIDEVAIKYSTKLKFCKLDMDANPESPQKYDVKGIPTLLIFRQGSVVGKKVGALSESQVTSFIDSLI